MYAPIEAAIDGRLDSLGTLRTVLLCEGLISYLPSGSTKDHPHSLLKSYDLLPTAVLARQKKIDLRRYATMVNGVLYVSRPMIEKVWVPMATLPASARATARQMLTFLEKLKAGCNSRVAVNHAAKILVQQFKHYLVEMDIVDDIKKFKAPAWDGCVFD